MEQLVENVASELLSTEDTDSFAGHFAVLKDLRTKGWTNVDSRNKLCRLLQELLAYKRGAVIRRLLQQIVRSDPLLQERSSHARDDCHLALLALAETTESAVVAKFCGLEADGTHALAKALLVQHAAFVGKALVLCRQGCDTQGMQRWIRLALEVTRSFVNLSRASKPFRLGLQKVEDFFPAILDLASDKHMKMLDVVTSVRVVAVLLLLLETFSKHEDSRDWALNQGLLKIAVMPSKLSVYTKPGDVLPVIWDSGSAFDREIAAMEEIMRMIPKPQEKRKVQDRLLRESRKKLEEIGLTLKALINQQTSGSEPSSSECEGEVGTLIRLAACANGQMDTPIVCAWELCEVGSEVEAGRRFSKCSSCFSAFYCSKEHQKLHWRSHKKHCKTGVESNIPGTPNDDEGADKIG